MNDRMKELLEIEERWHAASPALEQPAEVLSEPILVGGEAIGQLAWLSDPDANFVSHARQDVGTLIGEVIRLNAELSGCGCGSS